MSLYRRIRWWLPGPSPQVASERLWRRRIDRMHRENTGLSPMRVSLRLAELMDVLPAKIHAIEPFGMCGLRKTRDYAGLCETLDLFEIEPSFAAEARRAVPEARVHERDSIKAIREGDLPRDDYTLAVIDNPTMCYGPYCEHLDLFPAIYDVMAPGALMLTNVQLDGWIPDDATEQRQRRRMFYGGAMDSGAAALAFYDDMARSAGHDVRFSAIVPHPGEMMFVLQSLSHPSA